jgi:hypothetical protein
LIPDRESPKVKAIQPTIVQKKPAEAPKRTGKVKKPSEHLSPKTQSPSSKPVATSNNKAIEKPISTKPTRSLKTATSSSPPAESKPKKTTPITTRVPTSQKPNRPAPKQATLDQSTLNVQSAPPGARFYVNGTYKGATPIKVKLPYGKYEVRLQHKKYFGWEAQINLDKPGEIPLRIRLIPED